MVKNACGDEISSRRLQVQRRLNLDFAGELGRVCWRHGNVLALTNDLLGTRWPPEEGKEVLVAKLVISYRADVRALKQAVRGRDGVRQSRCLRASVCSDFGGDQAAEK